jgi:hypothetical protein
MESMVCLFIYLFIYLFILGFELRALHLQTRHFFLSHTSSSGWFIKPLQETHRLSRLSKALPMSFQISLLANEAEGASLLRISGLLYFKPVGLKPTCLRILWKAC